MFKATSVNWTVTKLSNFEVICQNNADHKKTLPERLSNVYVTLFDVCTVTC